MIITLCGSTKFKKEFERAMEVLTLEGHIVISVGLFGHQRPVPLDVLDKAMLDRLHLKKIDMADEVFVIDPGNYIGESTSKEIKYAQDKGKGIKYYSSDERFAEPDPNWMVMYDAPETASYDSLHTILLKFQYGEHTAQVVTKMGGNTYGASLLGGYDDFELGVSGPIDHPINQKHCIFEESDYNNREIEQIRFFHPTRPEELVDIEEAGGYLIGLEIIKYEEDRNQ